MTSGMLFALAISALVVAVLIGLVRRQRNAGARAKDGDPATAAQWTEGETTRLLSSAELPGLYLLRPRFLSKAESVVYLLIKAAFPRHDIFARVRLADVLQVKIGPQGMERLRAFRKIANQHVGFVVCDRSSTPRSPSRFRTHASRSLKSSSSVVSRQHRSSTSACIRRHCHVIASSASRYWARPLNWFDVRSA